MMPLEFRREKLILNFTTRIAVNPKIIIFNRIFMNAYFATQIYEHSPEHYAYRLKYLLIGVNTSIPDIITLNPQIQPIAIHNIRIKIDNTFKGHYKKEMFTFGFKTNKAQFRILTSKNWEFFHHHFLY